MANDSYKEEIVVLQTRLISTNAQIEEYIEKLKNVISTAEYAGDSTVIDDFNDQIFKLKDELLKINFALQNSQQEQRLKADLDQKIRPLVLPKQSSTRPRQTMTRIIRQL